MELIIIKIILTSVFFILLSGLGINICGDDVYLKKISDFFALMNAISIIIFIFSVVSYIWVQ